MGSVNMKKCEHETCEMDNVKLQTVNMKSVRMSNAYKDTIKAACENEICENVKRVQGHSQRRMKGH